MSFNDLQPMENIEETLAQGMACHRAGRLQQAAEKYAGVLQSAPDHAGAWHLLGVVASQSGELETAEVSLHRAIELQPGIADFHNDLGLVCRARKQTAQAEACYRRALELNPDFPQAHHNLGNLLRDQGEIKAAEGCYRRALELAPSFALAHYHLGMILQQQGQWEEAVICHRNAVETQPDFAEAHVCLGHALKDLVRLEEALESYKAALQLKPNHAPNHNNLGVVFQALGRLPEAYAAFQHALALAPDYAIAHQNAAMALCAQGKAARDDAEAEAETHARRAVELAPGLAGAHSTLGEVLKAQGRLAEAIVCFRRSLELQPQSAEAHSRAEAHFNLGNLYRDLEQFEQAVAAFRGATACNAEFYGAWNNLGNTLKEWGLRRPADRSRLFHEADACYQQAIACAPDSAEIHHNRSLFLLLDGNLAAGWPEYEWRWKAAKYAPRSFPQPLWNGEPLHGRKILLHSEQGLGDTLQFMRYAALVQERGGRVIFVCQNQLRALISRTAGIDQLLGNGEALPEFDVHAPLMSLPGIFDTTLASIPAKIPYAFADPLAAERWREKLEPGDGLNVAIAWQGNPEHEKDRLRSIPLARFTALSEVPGIRLFSTQKGHGTEQLHGPGCTFPVTELGFIDFVDTAAVMSHMDLVISCDTAMAHLAGALGRPVWLALSHTPDWRWLLDRDDSPWYPTMRLFRQITPGRWEEVFARMASELGKLRAGLPVRGSDSSLPPRG